jgi:hypothetical protein
VQKREQANSNRFAIGERGRRYVRRSTKEDDRRTRNTEFNDAGEYFPANQSRSRKRKEGGFFGENQGGIMDTG